MAKTDTVTETELPPPGRQQGDRTGVWGKRFEKAKVQQSAPKWVRILKCDTPDQAANHARNINHGRVVLPEGTWEASARTDTQSGESWVWVRFVE